VNATDNESGIDRIEFYIDDVLQGNDTSSPYEWTWKTRVFFSHTLKVIAYNTEELNTSVSLRVMKFF